MPPHPPAACAPGVAHSSALDRFRPSRSGGWIGRGREGMRRQRCRRTKSSTTPPPPSWEHNMRLSLATKYRNGGGTVSRSRSLPPLSAPLDLTHASTPTASTFLAVESSSPPDADLQAEIGLVEAVAGISSFSSPRWTHPSPRARPCRLFAAREMSWPHVLTAAGSDSGAGAGIQADLKACAALGAYCSDGVQGVHLVPEEFIR